MGSSKSKTILAPAPRWAMPMTSFTCTSRQARTHKVQWMHASSATRMAGWLASGAGASRAGSRLSVTSSRSAHCHRRERESWATSRPGWSATSSSSTIRRALRAAGAGPC